MAMNRRSVSGGYLPLRDAMNQLFETSFITPQGMGQGGFPAADLYVTDNDVLVEMAIPGANPDDINVAVTGDTVTISGEIRHQHQRQKGQPFVQELFDGKFQRSFTLPIEVNANQADATFHNGILTLTLPKSEATKPRKIEVKQGQPTIQGQTQGSQRQGDVQTEQVSVQRGSSS